MKIQLEQQFVLAQRRIQAPGSGRVAVAADGSWNPSGDPAAPFGSSKVIGEAPVWAEAFCRFLKLGAF